MLISSTGRHSWVGTSAADRTDTEETTNACVEGDGRMITPAELAASINKVLGTEAVRLGSSITVELIPTGVFPIDSLLGGGVPRNRFVEFFGDYSTLKSYIGLSTIKETQAMGGTAALIDTEHAFDPVWAESIGVDVESLIYLTPENGELAVDVTEALVRQGVDLVVWDSVAATLPESEQTKREFNTSHQPARLAALMSRATRKLTAANTRTALMFINQTRVNVGQMFGNPETVPGGKALPFYASHRVSLRKVGRVTEEQKVYDGEKWVKSKVIVAQKIRATLEKSKLTAPHQDVLFQFDLKQGAVDEDLFLFSRALQQGAIVQPSKGTYQVLDWEGSWRGKDNLIAEIRSNQDLVDHLLPMV